VDELFGICDALKERIKEAQGIQMDLADAVVEGAVSWVINLRLEQ